MPHFYEITTPVRRPVPRNRVRFTFSIELQRGGPDPIFDICDSMPNDLLVATKRDALGGAFHNARSKCPTIGGLFRPWNPPGRMNNQPMPPQKPQPAARQRSHSLQSPAVVLQMTPTHGLPLNCDGHGLPLSQPLSSLGTQLHTLALRLFSLGLHDVLHFLQRLTRCPLFYAVDIR